MEFISNLGRRAILVWSLLLFFILMLSCFLFTATLPMDGSELMRIGRNGLSVWLTFLLFLVLFAAVAKLLSKLDEKWIFLVGSVLYLGIGAYLIGHQNDMLRHDALAVLEAAKALNRGDYSLVTAVSGYLYKYPHQLGLVSFERIILFIFGHENIKSLLWINLFMGIADQFLLWRITKNQFQKEEVTKAVLLLSFLFLPHLFFILFAYSITYSLFFSLLGIFFFQRYLKETSILSFVLVIVFFTIAHLIRNNTIILILSVIVILLLEFFKNQSKKHIALAICLFLAASLSSRMLISHYQNASGVEKLEGEPKIAWVAMGLDDNPIYNRIPGWYDAYVENVYNEYKGDSDLIKKASYDTLSNRLTYMRSNPLYTLRFFKNKFVSTWIDSLFQSIWSGPLPKSKVEGQQVRGGVMESIYHGGAAYHMLYRVSASVLFLIYIFVFSSILNLSRKRQTQYFDLLVLVYFTGGVLFHLIWETKSQYAYPYVYLLLPLCAYGYDCLKGWLKTRMTKQKKSVS